MKLLAAIVALALFVPSADAAVIAATKVKKLPVIENVRVGIGLKGFGFDIASMPPVSKYDVWISIENARGKKVDEWYVGSVSARRGKKAPRTASFKTDVGDLIKYERDGTYSLTAYLCPPNLKKPNAKACAHGVTSVESAE
jgi:hypothetical protein